MQVRDTHVLKLIERIGEHYRSNISNHFIRPTLLQLPLDKQVWSLVETLTEKAGDYRNQGFHLDELYLEIIAAARFVSVTRRDLVPTLRTRVAGTASRDKVLRDMAVNNFGSNLQLFAGMVNELYNNLVELDKQNNIKGRSPLYASMPELADVSRLLAG